MDKQPIRAIFNGVQQAAEPFELWTILEPIEGHPQYSTVSRRTIEAQGHKIIQVEREEVKRWVNQGAHNLRRGRGL